MSTAIIKTDSYKPEGLVITIKENKSVHQFVNKVTGSRALLTFHDIIGSSLPFKETVKLSKAAGRSFSNVLLLGESGTGKELFAQSIHNYGDRKNGPFIAVNCGALPRNLVESELFGYEGGAFTGSRKEGNPGKFELADEGTIFLDEIGDMPLEAQVNLLRVLETGEVVRVGGKFPKKINVRIIAATNKNLQNAVKEKTFRDDLYYRLNVFTVNIPPLRDRKDDIRPLVDFFTRKFSTTLWKTINEINDEAYRALEAYDWPGNIRELENVIERAVNVAETTELRIQDLPELIKEKLKNISELVEIKKDTLLAKEYETIVQSLNETGGNMRQASQKLGIARSTLYEKMKKFNISKNHYR